MRRFVPTETLLMIYRSLIIFCQIYFYGNCVWGRAAKSYISKRLVLQKRALRLIYFAPCDVYAIPLLTEYKIYFDAVANLMHDIWEGLAPLPIRALFTRSNEIHGYNIRHAAKGNYLRKEVQLENFKRSILITGAILWNQIYPDQRDISKQKVIKAGKRVNPPCRHSCQGNPF